MRKKVRKSLAFLLALALVVSVMSGLGLSVSADEAQPQTEPAQTEEVQDEAVKETPKAEKSTPKEGEKEEEADPDAEAVPEEKKDVKKAEGEGSGDESPVKDTTADPNGEQKDEPQAEPAAEEPAEPEEEPAASYLSTLSVEELYAYLTKLDDNNFAAAWKELTDSQKADYNAYVLKMTFGDNKTTTSYEGGAGAKAMTQAAGLVESAAVSSSSLLRKSPARAAKEAAAQLVTESKKPADGLVMKKTISKDNADSADTKYTIKLESYATGSETTTVQKTSKPCDIVLVLDQSGSMAYTMNRVRFQDKAFATTAQNVLAYKYKNSLFVKVRVDGKEKHIPVELERKIVSSEVTPSYSGDSKYNSEWYELFNSSSKPTNYYYKEGNNYYQVTGVTRTGNVVHSYTYKYNGGKGEENGDFLSTTLYEKEGISNNTYQYIYTYTANGTERKVTKDGNTSQIPSQSNDPDFFDGTDGNLYYSQESTTGSEPRLDALKNAVNSFVTSVENDKDSDGKAIDHHIAIVGFSSTPGDRYGYDYNNYDYNNTEVLTGCQITKETTPYIGTAASTSDSYYYPTGYPMNGVQYNASGYATATRNALQSTKDSEGKASITNAINALTAHGATRTDLGITMAKDIFAAQSDDRKAQYEKNERSKVVVVFTDGSPTSSSNFSNNVAKAAIQEAQTLKSEGTTVYTIGIFSGADATKEPSTDSNNRENTFMHFASSNYPNASSMTSSGTKAKDGYYLSATNSSELSQIFQSISQNIHGSTTSVQLDETTQNIDKMSEDFQFRSGLTEADIKDSIKVYTVPYIGKVDGVDTFNEEKKTDLANAGIEVSGDRVTVTGYSYKDEYIATVQGENRGTKLVIEIPVEYKNDAWFGGNNIASNDIGSGIYNNNQCYGTYDVPQVNRVIDYKIAAKDQTIYVTNKADLKELLDYPQKDADRTYQPNGTNNRYVDITYTLKQGDTVIGTYEIKRGQSAGTWTPVEGQDWNPALEDCTEYTWTCTVKPTSEGKGALGVDGTPDKPAEEKSYGPETGTVHVLYPTVKAEDKTIYWGELANAAGQVKDAEVWKDKNGHSDIPEANGQKPTVTVTPKYVAGDENETPASDVAYNVTVKVGDKDVTEVVRGMNGIATTKKEHSERNCDDHDAVDKATYDFCIHVKSKKLTVEKKVTGNMGDTNQKFAFKGTNVYGGNATFNLTDGKSETFKLKVGEEATVTETAAAGYTTTISDNADGKAGTAKESSLKYTYKVAEDSPDTVTVTYTNDKTINPPNGIITTIAPYAIMVVLAAGAGVYFVYSRRRRNR